jgi:hypothetical protein
VGVSAKAAPTTTATTLMQIRLYMDIVFSSMFAMQSART